MESVYIERTEDDLHLLKIEQKQIRSSKTICAIHR